MGDNWTSGGDNWNSGPNDSFNNDFGSGSAGGLEAANGEIDNARPGGGCRNCGQDGHFARECTEPKSIICFNCEKPGHSKAECSEPKVFKGACHICGGEGHPASRCPSKPKVCTRCKQDNDHDTKDCKNNFCLDLNDVADVTEGKAWAKIVNASLCKDMDDFKDALRMLQKAAPELTYPAVEKKLRAHNLKFYLIALKKDVGDGYTLVNLQGDPDKAYCMAIFQSPDCQRPNMISKWPKSPEENLERLADAGIPMERGLPYCRNCSTFAHATRDCDQDKVTYDGPQVQCALCNEPGHRVRDCDQPRQKPRAPKECKICGSDSHLAKECDQKPAMVCRNCEQEGHKASECTEEKVLRCNNCSEVGHVMRQCPKPIEYEKMTCRYCGEKGHLSANRCAPGAAKKQENGTNKNENTQETIDTADGGWDAENNASADAVWDTNLGAQPTVGSNGW